MVLIRVEIIHMPKFKAGAVEKNIINYIRSSGRNRTYAFVMPVQCSYHYATEVADKSRRNVMCTKGGNACEYVEGKSYDFVALHSM